MLVCWSLWIRNGNYGNPNKREKNTHKEWDEEKTEEKENDQNKRILR